MADWLARLVPRSRHRKLSHADADRSFPTSRLIEQTDVMAKSKAPTEADLVFNRVSIAAARSRKLLQSWSRPGNTEEAATTQTAEELEEEEAEVFKPDSESYSSLSLCKLSTSLTMAGPVQVMMARLP